MANEDVMDPNYGKLGLADLNDIRQTDQIYIQYRLDARTAEEYRDGNQTSQDDAAVAENQGIQLVTANYIGMQLNDVRGIQESALARWKVHGENPEKQDMYDALGAELFKAERQTNADRNCLRAYGSQICGGFGVIEVGRRSNPFEGRYKADDVLWSQMWFDIRARSCVIDDGSYVRRMIVFHKDKLKKAFSGSKDAQDAIESGPTPAQFQYPNIEPTQGQRTYTDRRGREVALAYQDTPMDKNLRCLEEIWVPVYLEGVCIFLPGGKVSLYDPKNPMHRMLSMSGIARLEKAPYKHWRRSFWCGDYSLDDIWSPFPWRSHGYVFFFGYREAMTGVPYGLARGMISLQDEINSAAAKMHFGIDATRVIVEEGAVADHNQVRRDINSKRAYIITKNGKLDAIKVDEHFQLNEQNYKRMEDAIQQIRETSGVGGLNPAAMLGKDASGEAMNAVTLRAMANIGEIQGNYRESRTMVGSRLLDLVAEDISQKGDVPVHVVKPHTGEKKIVRLHFETGETWTHGDESGVVIDNDVTLLHAEVALDDVPNTVTYRGQQLQDFMKILQSAPPGQPGQLDLRTLLMPDVIRLMEIPHAEEKARKLAEATGVIPPQTPEAQQAAQAAAQQRAQQQQIATEGAVADVEHRKAQTQKLGADAELKHVQAQATAADVKDPQFEQANQQLLLERTAVQNQHKVAQTAKIQKEMQQPPQEQQGPPQGW